MAALDHAGGGGGGIGFDREQGEIGQVVGPGGVDRCDGGGERFIRRGGEKRLFQRDMGRDRDDGGGCAVTRDVDLEGDAAAVRAGDTVEGVARDDARGVAQGVENRAGDGAGRGGKLGDLHAGGGFEIGEHLAVRGHGVIGQAREFRLAMRAAVGVGFDPVEGCERAGGAVAALGAAGRVGREGGEARCDTVERGQEAAAQEDQRKGGEGEAGEGQGRARAEGEAALRDACVEQGVTDGREFRFGMFEFLHRAARCAAPEVYGGGICGPVVCAAVCEGVEQAAFGGRVAFGEQVERLHRRISGSAGGKFGVTPGFGPCAEGGGGRGAQIVEGCGGGGRSCEQGFDAEAVVEKAAVQFCANLAQAVERMGGHVGRKGLGRGPVAVEMQRQGVEAAPLCGKAAVPVAKRRGVGGQRASGDLRKVVA